MNKETIIEGEKGALLDYLFGYCDNPLATADNHLRDLFSKYNEDRPELVRTILEESYMDITACTSPPVPEPYTIWLDVAEIEVESDMVEPDETEDFTFTNGMAYLYIGYGFIVGFDVNNLIGALQFYKGVNNDE